MDLVLHLKTDGINAVVADVQRATDAANGKDVERRQRTMATYRRELAGYARAERTETFASLSVEEKRVKLTERMATLEERIARARAGGNDMRATALKLQQRRVGGALSSLPAAEENPGFFRSLLSGFRSRAEFPGKGMFGGEGVGGSAFGGALVGGAVGAGVGIAVMKAVEVLREAASEALHLGDAVKDLAENLNTSTDNVLKARRASDERGVSNARVTRAMGRLTSSQSAALGGDPAMLALFKQYGVSPDMLANGDPFEIAEKIRRSLGGNGVLKTDIKPLSGLLGRNPDQILGVIGEMNRVTPGLNDDDIQRLDKFSKSRERTWNKMVDWVGKKVGQVAWFYNPEGPGDSFGNGEGRSDSLFTSGAAAARTAGMVTPTVAKKTDAAHYAGTAAAADVLSRIGLFRGGTNQQLKALQDQVGRLNVLVQEIKGLRRDLTSDV